MLIVVVNSIKTGKQLPNRSGKGNVHVPPKLTDWKRPVRYVLNQDSSEPDTSNREGSQCCKIAWSMVSKAALWSRRARITAIAVRTSSKTFRRAVSVEWYAIYGSLTVTRRHCAPRLLVSSLATTHSWRSLDKKVNACRRLTRDAESSPGLKQ